MCYIVSDQNESPHSRSSTSGVKGVIKQLIILDIDVVILFEESFLEANNLKDILVLVIEAIHWYLFLIRDNSTGLFFIHRWSVWV